MTRVALVTGATQGLGLALAHGLAERMQPSDVVYLTGRDADRAAAGAAAAPPGGAEVRGELLDVSSDENVRRLASELAERHGRMDIVFSNAYSRVEPGEAPAAVIDRYVEVNNLGATRMLRAFAPLLADRARLIVVASTMGTLHYLAPVLHERLDHLHTLEDVDAAVGAWRESVHSGRAVPEGWPAFINIPSKVAQVSAVRTLARIRREHDLARGILIAAACPGMLDTGASRPWFDTSAAQTPAEGAVALLDLALDPTLDSEPMYGELVRFGEVLPWRA